MMAAIRKQESDPRNTKQGDEMEGRECLLSTRQVAQIVGLKYATLDRWLRPERGGFLECAEGAEGRGSRRGFGFLDVLRIDTLARLRRGGVSMQTIRRVLADLSDKYAVSDPLLDGGLVVAGSRLFWAIDDRTLLDVLKQQLAAAPLVVIPMGDMIREDWNKVVAICGEKVA